MHLTHCTHENKTCHILSTGDQVISHNEDTSCTDTNVTFASREESVASVDLLISHSCALEEENDYLLVEKCGLQDQDCPDPVKGSFFFFQTHLVQLIKPSQVFVRPTGIQALPSPLNSIIIIIS